MEATTTQVKKVPNPEGKGGFGDNPQNRNDGGRIRNPLKEFQREEFANMTPAKKRKYLAGVDKYRRWAMAEGNPETDNNHKIIGDVVISFDEAFKKRYEKK